MTNHNSMLMLYNELAINQNAWALIHSFALMQFKALKKLIKEIKPINYIQNFSVSALLHGGHLTSP